MKKFKARNLITKNVKIIKENFITFLIAINLTIN